MKEDLYHRNPTLYCSVMAHLRGKLHMTKMRYNTLYDLNIFNYTDFIKYIHTKDNNLDEYRQILKWNMENQAEYVKDTIKKYILEKDPTAIVI